MRQRGMHKAGGRQNKDKMETERERAEYLPSIFLLSGSGRARDHSVEEEMEKKDERRHEQRER